MTETPTKLSPAEHLARRIQENRIASAQWRAEHGDPGEALGKLLFEQFGIEAILETYQEYLDHENSFLWDDYDDEREEDDGPNGGEPG